MSSSNIRRRLTCCWSGWILHKAEATVAGRGSNSETPWLSHGWIFREGPPVWRTPSGHIVNPFIGTGRIFTSVVRRLLNLTVLTAGRRIWIPRYRLISIDFSLTWFTNLSVYGPKLTFIQLERLNPGSASPTKLCTAQSGLIRGLRYVLYTKYTNTIFNW